MKLKRFMIIRYILLPVAVCALLLTTGCGGKKSYKIDGTVEGLGTQNLTVIYHDGNALREFTTNAVDSKFHIEGMSDEPVAIELYDNKGNRIGCVVARNGEEISVKYKVSDRNYMEAKGNKLSAALAEFLQKNGNDLNSAIEHRLTSTAADELSELLAGYYYDINANAQSADSLLRLADSESHIGDVMLRYKSEIAARLSAAPAKIERMRLLSSADSLTNYEPSAKTNTLYIFTDIYSIPDSIVEYADSVAKDMKVASVRLAIDSFGWHKDTARFSKKVTHLWAPGGVADSALRSLDIPRVPFFIVADTTGAQIYRGSLLPPLK